jgi:hypothetical protein
MTKPQRLLLIDWLRICVLFAIVFLHCNEFVFFTDIIPNLGETIAFESVMRYFAWPLTLGGQVLVALIYLLFGLTGKTQKSLLLIAGFALIGQVLVTVSFNDTKDIIGNLEWDIYFFIAATNLILLALPRASWALVGLMSLLMTISPELWKKIIPDGFIGDLLTGRDYNGPEGAWSMIPWLFFAILFFNLGSLIRGGKIPLEKWHRPETFAWTIFLGISLPFIGAYYATPLGPHYYEWNFHKPSWIFWANFVPYILIMRLSFLTSVQEKLNRHRLSRWIGSLMWNRQLGASYIISVLYIGMGAQHEDFFLEHPMYFDLFFLSVMPVTEIIVRILMLARKRLLPRGGSSAR